jgi:hypothetical protein
MKIGGWRTLCFFELDLFTPVGVPFDKEEGVVKNELKRRYRVRCGAPLFWAEV